MEPLKVVIYYKGKLYRNIITNYQILSDNYTIILPKYKNKQYYSDYYYLRMTNGTGKWEELQMVNF